MLTVYRSNEKVVVSIDTGLANNCQGNEKATLEFSWNCAQPYLADALARHISRVVRDAIAEAREKSYQEGWADAKAKRAKRETFQDWL